MLVPYVSACPALRLISPFLFFVTVSLCHLSKYPILRHFRPDHVAKVIFSVKEDGLMTLTDKFNNLLWDSGTKKGAHLGPYTLKYQNDGDLVLYYNSGLPLWRSNTKYAACGNKNPGKVTLSKGSLEIHPEHGGGVLWSTMSTKSGVPTKSAAVYHMCGDNTCSKQCVKLYKHANFVDKSATLGAGSYDHDLFIAWNMGHDAVTGVEISNGCEVDLYEHAGYGGRKWSYRQSVDFCAGGSCSAANDQVTSMRIRSCSLVEMAK